MSMAWFSDLVIVIFGLGATLAIILITFMAFRLYVRIRAILDSLKTTARTVESMTHRVDEEVARPLGQVISVIRGIREGFGFFSSFRSKGGD